MITNQTKSPPKPDYFDCWLENETGNDDVKMKATHSATEVDPDSHESWIADVGMDHKWNKQKECLAKMPLQSLHCLCLLALFLWLCKNSQSMEREVTGHFSPEGKLSGKSTKDPGVSDHALLKCPCSHSTVCAFLPSFYGGVKLLIQGEVN